MSLFLPLMLATLLLLLACYGAGTAACRLLRVARLEPWLMVLVQLTAGLLLLTTLYAAVRTQGRTVLLPALGLWPVALRLLRRPDPGTLSAASQSLAGPLASVLLVGVGVFTARWFLLYDPASPFLRTPFQDYVYYGRLSVHLDRVGVETSSLLSPAAQGLAHRPYHYLELWLNAALVRATHLPATWALYLSTYSALITLVVVGFRAVLAQVGLLGAPAAVLAPLLVLVTGVYWPVFAHYPFLHNGVYIANGLLPIEPKTAPVYLLVLLGGGLLLRRSYMVALLVLLNIPLTFISTAPAGLAGLGGLLLCLGATRRVSRRAWWAMAAATAAVAAYVAGFYLLQQQPLNAANLDAPWQLTWRALLTAINVAVGTLLNFTIYYAAYGLFALVLLLVAKRRLGHWPQLAAGNTLLVWLLGTGLAAGGIRALAAPMLDSYQLFSNLMLPLAAFCLAIVLGLVLSLLPKVWAGGVAIVLLALAGVNSYKLFTLTNPLHQATRYAPGFLRQVQRTLPALGECGAFVLADAEYLGAYMLNPESFTAGTYLANFKNAYTLVSLSQPMPDQLRTDPRFVQNVAYAQSVSVSAAFSQWLLAHGLALTTAARDSLTYQFVRDKKLRFVCVSSSAELPPPLRTLVTAAYADPWSGEKFYVLNPAAAPRFFSADKQQQ